jgi:copper(I)-binding protein
MRLFPISLLLAGVLISACSEKTLPPLVASDVNIAAPIPGKTMSAGYLSITNNTDDTISISRVGSSHFESIQIHESVLEDGIAKMHRLDELTIPAHSTVKLEPGGKHLMLMRPTGTSNQISLSFFSAETLLLGVTTTLTTRTL